MSRSTPRTAKSRTRPPPYPPSSPPDSIYAQPSFTSPVTSPRATRHVPPTIPSTSTDSGSYPYEDFRPVRIVGCANQRTFNTSENYPKLAFMNSRMAPTLASIPRLDRPRRVAEGELLSVKVLKKPKHNRLLKAYSDIVYNYPSTILMATLIMFIGLPMCLLQIYPLKLNENPEKGFDTRGTVNAERRLTWAQIQPFLFQGSRVVIKQPPPPPEELKFIDPISIMEQRKLNINKINDSVVLRPTTLSPAGRKNKRATEGLFESLSSVACYEIELIQMDYMSQFIVELDSYDRLFDLKFHQELCALQEQLQHWMMAFYPVTPYRSIFHAANFAGCLSPLNKDNCSSLVHSDLKSFKILLEFCFESRTAIIECGRDCIASGNSPEDRKNCHQCESIPSNCTSQMMFDLFYRILPMDLMVRKASNDVIYVNNFLPFYTFSSYGFQGFNVPLKDFVDFEKRFEKVAADSKTFKIKGYLLDIKRDILFDSALTDSKLAVLAAVLVFTLILLYSCSIGYTFAVLVELGASVLISMAIYRFFSTEFPLLNLVSFVLLLSIGTDGAFLLYSIFPEKHEYLDEDNFYECMEHTTATMFLAQFSTVVPFMLNLVSSVIAFRSFGLFAGMTLIFNYFLLISFLPAYLVFKYRYIDPFIEDKCSCFASFSDTCSSIDKVKKKIKYFITEQLTGVLIDGRYVWLCILVVVIAGGTFMTATQLKLPQYNPLQLFTFNNPHEWYDIHAEKLFEFVSKKIALPLAVRLLWGFKGTEEVSRFNPNLIGNVTQDRGFRLKTKEDVRKLADDMQRFRMMEFVSKTGKFWPERFLDWSRSIPCVDDIAVCCNIDSQLYQDDFLDYCLRVSTSQMQTGYNDTPIYHNISFDLVGYTAMLPTRLKYSHKFQQLSKNFDILDQNLVSTFTDAFFYTTEWTLMSTWYDLQKSIIHDCQQSVIISFIVVLIFAAAMLRWKAVVALISMMSIVICTVGIVVALGWEIGVLEAVILVLVVSLSFDYTLHFGAAIPDEGCAEHRIYNSVRRTVIPVSMASLSSALAGILMLFSKTHAFFQVATFLIVSAIVSWAFSLFLFLPLVYLFLPKVADNCRECDLIEREIINRRQNVPMHVMRGTF